MGPCGLGKNPTYLLRECKPLSRLTSVKLGEKWLVLFNSVNICILYQSTHTYARTVTHSVQLLLISKLTTFKNLWKFVPNFLFNRQTDRQIELRKNINVFGGGKE